MTKDDFLIKVIVKRTGKEFWVSLITSNSTITWGNFKSKKAAMEFAQQFRFKKAEFVKGDSI